MTANKWEPTAMAENIDILIDTGKTFTTWLKENKGFDRCNFNSVQILPDGKITWEISCRDSFQDTLPYERWCFYGTKSFTSENLFEKTHKGQPIPSREIRELTVLSAQMGETTGLRSALVSAQGQQFVDELIVKRQDFNLLLGPDE